MKPLLVAAILAAGAAGFWAARLTRSVPPRPGPATPHPPPAYPAPPELRAGESVSRTAAPAAVDPLPPKKRLLQLMRGHLDEKRIFEALRQAALGARDGRIQRDAWELLSSTEDVELMKEIVELLISIKDPSLMKEILDRFKTEDHRERRHALAYILGANWEQAEIQPIFLELLEGEDAALQEEMLERMCVQEDKVAEEVRRRVTARLRLLVQAGASDGLRAAAARSMRGADAPDDIRFLIDVMVRDPSRRVQSAAMGSLPCNYESPSPLLDEQARALHAMALDETRPVEFRSWAADRVLFIVAGGGADGAYKLAEGEEARLKAVLEKGK